MNVHSIVGKTIFVVWTGMIVLFAMNFAGCSAGGGTGSGVQEDPAGTADAATSAVTDSVASSLTSLGGSPAALSVKGQSASYSCSFNSEDGSQTCDCPGGGTVTYSYDDMHILEGSVELDHSFQQTFDNCVVPTCDGNKTINGEFTGHMQGHFDPEGEISVTATVQTAEQCAGLSVDDVNVGFEITMSWDGTNQTVAGTLCLDPPGDVITFDSYEELMEAMNPDSACSSGD